MKETYRAIMEKQQLSKEGCNTFYAKLSNNRKRKQSGMKAALIAVCVCLLIPLTVLAAQTIFGFSIVQIANNAFFGKPGKSYTVRPDVIRLRPITDFAEEVRAVGEFVQIAYDSWEDAEEALGIDLLNNSVLFDGKSTPKRSFLLTPGGNRGDYVHCYTSYSGFDGQLYTASVKASYLREDMSIILHAEVVAEHPSITEEEAQELFFFGAGYPGTTAEDITQEQYIAANGITANIVTVKRSSNASTVFDASFVVGSVICRVEIKDYHSYNEAHAKETLLQILDAFTFE